MSNDPSTSATSLIVKLIAFVAVLVVIGFISAPVSILGVVAGLAVGATLVAISRRVRRPAPQVH